MSSDTTEAETKETPTPNPAWLVVRAQLRSRAKRARIMRDCMFVVILVVVVSGGLGIWFTPNRIADELPIPVSGSSGWTELGSDYSTYDNFVSDVGVPKKSTSKGAKPNAELEKFKQKVEANLGELRSEVEKLPLQIADMKSAVASIESHVDSIEGAFKTVKDEMGTMKHEFAKGSPRLEFLVTTFATRFGFAAVILLLVKILTSIYRYHARIAAHYDSKADALELSVVGDVTMFEKLCVSLSTAGVDFQESADSIVEHAVEISRKMMPGSPG